LAMFSPVNQHAIREAGGLEALVEALRRCPDLRSSLAEEVARAMGNLARNFVNREALREAGGVQALVTVLWAGPGHASTREAVVALGNMAYESVHNQLAITEAGGVRGLLSLLRAGPDSGGEVVEAAGCVLACLVTCPEAVQRLCDDRGVAVVVDALNWHRSSPVVVEAMLNVLASLAALPHMAAVVQQAGGLQALAWALEGDPAIPDNRQEDIREVAAIAISSLAVGSPENRQAARECGALEALVHFVVAASPLEVAASGLPGYVTPRDRQRQAPKEVHRLAGREISRPPAGINTTQGLVMEVLVQLMDAGPDNMVAEVAGGALQNMMEKHQQQNMMMMQKEVEGDTPECPVQVVTDMQSQPRSARMLASKSASGFKLTAWKLPIAPVTWEADEDDGSTAVAKSVEIDPRHSVQVDALYSQAFVGSWMPSRSTEAAVCALGHLMAGNEENQAAAWEAGGVQLLEALIALAAMERCRCADDALRTLAALAAAQPNRNRLLESGGTELVVKLLRLGPNKEVSYVAARTVSLLLVDHPATVSCARELGAVEMLVRLLREPSEVARHLAASSGQHSSHSSGGSGGWGSSGSFTGASGGCRSVVAALSHLCCCSRDSQRVFRKVGGFQRLVQYLDHAVQQAPDWAAGVAKLVVDVCKGNKVNQNAFRTVSGTRLLVQLMKQDGLSRQGYLQVVRALQAIVAGHTANQDDMRSVGGMEVLADCLAKYTAPEQRLSHSLIASATIQLLAGSVGDNPTSQDEACEMGVIPVLVRLLSVGNDSVVMADVADVIKVLSRNHPRVKEHVLKAGGTQALLQLLALNLETELALVTSATWAVNNLAHQSEPNVKTILHGGGVQLLLRIVRGVEVRSPASVAASRALFILTSCSGEAAAALRREGGVEPCTMLLTSGPEAEASLWACSLLAILCDGHPETQRAIVSMGGLELLLSLISSGGPWKDVTTAAVRTMALILVDNQANQDKALKAGAVEILMSLLTESQRRGEKKASGSGLTTVLKLKSSCSLTSTGCSPLHSQLQTRLSMDMTEQGKPPGDAEDGLSVELAEMAIIALGNLGSGGVSHRMAIRRAGGLKVMEELVQADRSTNLYQLARWAHSILSASTRGPIQTGVHRAIDPLKTV